MVHEGGSRNVIVFGASGSLGSHIVKTFAQVGWSVTAVTRSGDEVPGASRSFAWDIGKQTLAELCIDAQAVVWAQGANLTDSIYNFDVDKHLEVYNTNIVYIMESLTQLISGSRMQDGARLCIISSIWQNLARQNKLSYCVSKSAIAGLVRSLAIDLGQRGCLVNAILPGPIDTPMTRQQLTADQIKFFGEASPLGRLSRTEELSEMAEFLCSERNSGITGQFINVDGGFSDARLV